jgi:outer membrane protein
MKKLFKVALVAVGMIFAGNFANAQTKIGHINFNAVIDAMPETKTVSAQIQAYQKTFIDVLTNMNNEYTTKGTEFQKTQASMTDAVRSQKGAELQDMQKRMSDYQTDAQQKVEAKKNELGKPLFDKATAAVQAVAKEKGYAYVLDSSQVSLLVSPDADDLMAAVKLKLGLK